MQQMQRHPSMRQSGRPNNGRVDKREGPRPADDGAVVRALAWDGEHFARFSAGTAEVAVVEGDGQGAITTAGCGPSPSGTYSQASNSSPEAVGIRTVVRGEAAALFFKFVNVLPMVTVPLPARAGLYVARTWEPKSNSGVATLACARGTQAAGKAARRLRGKKMARADEYDENGNEHPRVPRGVRTASRSTIGGRSALVR